MKLSKIIKSPFRWAKSWIVMFMAVRAMRKLEMESIAKTCATPKPKR